MEVEAFRAISEADREDIFRFRYSIYVEELGRYRQTADHEGRRLMEPEDEHGVLYGARLADRVVATARMTFGEDGFSSRQIDQYSLAPFLAEVPARLMCIGERLMVIPELRGSTVTLALRALMEEDTAARDVRLVFGDCEPHLLSLNLSLGCRPYAERNINSEEAGYLIPVLSFVGGTEGLAEAIGCLDEAGVPFLPPSIEAALARGGAVASPFIETPDQYRHEVESALERLASSELHAFAGLSDHEIEECISRSNIIRCAQGDRVIKEGGSARNLFLVLDGTLEVRHDSRLLNVLLPGDVFGEMAFLLGLARQSDVYAATTEVRVLCLSGGTLRKLLAEEPTLAAKLMLNISRMLCGRLIKANTTIGNPSG
jgi:hypothetical protein